MCVFGKELDDKMTKRNRSGIFKTPQARLPSVLVVKIVEYVCAKRVYELDASWYDAIAIAWTCKSWLRCVRGIQWRLTCHDLWRLNTFHLPTLRFLTVSVMRLTTIRMWSNVFSEIYMSALEKLKINLCPVQHVRLNLRHMPDDNTLLLNIGSQHRCPHLRKLTLNGAFVSFEACVHVINTLPVLTLFDLRCSKIERERRQKKVKGTVTATVTATATVTPRPQRLCLELSGVGEAGKSECFGEFLSGGCDVIQEYPEGDWLHVAHNQTHWPIRIRSTTSTLLCNMELDARPYRLLERLCINGQQFKWQILNLPALKVLELMYCTLEQPIDTLPILPALRQFIALYCAELRGSWNALNRQPRLRLTNLTGSLSNAPVGLDSRFVTIWQTSTCPSPQNTHTHTQRR